MSADSKRAATEAVLAMLCRELKLSAVLSDYKAVCRQAEDEDWSYEEFLAELLEREVGKRRDNGSKRRILSAHFPDLKTLDQLNFQALKGVSRTKIQQLASGQFIEDKKNIVLVGPIGTGKTHLAIALGIEAAKRRTRVAFVRASQLVRQLVEARDERQLTRLLRRYQRIGLLIVDELGFVPLNSKGLTDHLMANRVSRR